MSDPTLHQLEREVEASRAKLAGHLSVLRSPGPYSEFTSDLKSDVLDAKDVLIDKAKSSVQSTFEGLVDDLKARAAANPAAALAIGAGIAWRLIKHPPIATALVGAGLYSLFRTSASQHGPRTNEAYLAQAKERLAEQASDFAEGVKDQAVALGERAAEKTTEFAASVKERAVTMGEKAAQLAGAATERAQDLSEEVRSSLTRAAEDVSGAARNATSTYEELRQSSMNAAELAASRATGITNGSQRSLQVSNGQDDARDQVLLGAAGVAVLAALSIAWQRRSSEPAHVD
jgi:hypothetical protein